MNAYKVKEKLKTIADRFGYNNVQQTTQLEYVFQHYDTQDVFEGLIGLFKEDHSNSSVRQELAGRLLFSMNLKASFDLHSEIKECLMYFDLSVEHLPFYFVEQCGLKIVEEVLESFKFEILSEKEEESLSTMKFWLTNYEKWKKE